MIIYVDNKIILDNKGLHEFLEYEMKTLANETEFDLGYKMEEMVEYISLHNFLKDSNLIILEENNFDSDLDIVGFAKDKESAKNVAIELQQIISESNLSYGELHDLNIALTKVANEYNLKNEFMENGVL